MLRVGLTGGLASGKSFVAAEFQRLGCPVLEADKLGHLILAEDPAVRSEVTAEFGDGVLDCEGAIDRKALGALAFSAPERLRALNAILHPRIFARQERFFAQVQERRPHALAIVEAAIMIETGSYKRYARIVLTACAREVQIRRFVDRGSGSRQDAEARLARQMPLDEKRRHAHYVIDTGSTRAHTLCQVREVHGRLRAEAGKGDQIAHA